MHNRLGHHDQALAEKEGLLEEIWLPLLTMSWTLWLSGDSEQAEEVEAMTRIVNGGYGFLLERERGLALPLLNVYLGSDAPTLADATRKLLIHLEHVPPPPLKITSRGRAHGSARCPAWSIPRNGPIKRQRRSPQAAERIRGAPTQVAGTPLSMRSC